MRFAADIMGSIVHLQATPHSSVVLVPCYILLTLPKASGWGPTQCTVLFPAI